MKFARQLSLSVMANQTTSINKHVSIQINPKRKSFGFFINLLENHDLNRIKNSLN